jgi:TRAP-type C4-dicarboxylate transport system substrate-binding protein
MPSHANLSSSFALLVGLIAAASAPAQAAEVVLRFGSINTENTLAYDQVLVPFARARR